MAAINCIEMAAAKMQASRKCGIYDHAKRAGTIMTQNRPFHCRRNCNIGCSHSFRWKTSVY